MITICSNVETLYQSIDRDYDYDVLREAAEMLTASDFRDIADMDGQRPCVEFELNSQFSAWHGGKFSDQARMYGLRTHGLVCYQSDDEQAYAMRISDELDRRLAALADMVATA